MRKLILLLFLISSLSCFSQDIDSLFMYYQDRQSRGDYAKALEGYTLIIGMDPEYTNAYLRRGFIHMYKGNYEQAISDYTFVLQKKPGYVWALISRGAAYNKLNKYKEALADFNKALSMNPETKEKTEILNNRGWSKKGLGDDTGACADWKESKRLGNEEAKLILKNTGCK